MDTGTRLHYEDVAKRLRADLKTWENDWASTHGGSKPGRQDIKNNGDIARKYKEYNKARDILAGKAAPPLPTEDSRVKKRKSAPRPSEGSIKRTKCTETPSKDPVRHDGLMNSPAVSRILFSPAPITSLGPTPQKDGRVLGLFDLLVERELGTPSRKNASPVKRTANRLNVQATPSKRVSDPHLDGESRLGRTPMSASKRQLLDIFMTPLRKRKGDGEGKTPTSVSKLQFDTPAFLKRHSLPTLEEAGSFGEPARLRLPRKPMVRGLSEIVASLRRVEEETCEETLDNDADMEALREAEEADLGMDRPGAVRKAPKPPVDVIVEDSQRMLPLGGFDDEGMYDSPVEDSTDRHGNPMVAYKKKGQKRTTRRSNMKPVKVSRPAAMDQAEDEEKEDEHVVPETQAAAAVEDAAHFDSELDGYQRDMSKAVAAAMAKADLKKEGAVRKTVRKVNELAHANFQKLKLRNSGLKGGPGYNSRFRRKR
ncbi:DNA replication regulator SLD2 [Drechmeria coniospora]|uniref:DNA replication regulator SLD2 n=1 Tax=Drechmeria coniospora TaxID=98403 RepID=A0A151GUU6_DRECN|nr:DNA replication regulator SLD2 [Drechmeria coniospora]KYK60792.1 DNA replication regulator SLD2 [Drechmeria coniospora]